MKVLEKFFENKFERKNLKYLYVGDSLMSDCGSAAKNKNWDSLAIIEELQDIAPELKNRAYLMKYEKNWGNYFYEMRGGVKVETAWMNYARKNIRYALPFVTWMKHLV